MAITEHQSGNELYDLTRPFVWLYRSTTAANLVYRIQKLDVFNAWVNISGKIRQPREFGSLFNFYINPSEMLADEINTAIRDKNESDYRSEFGASVTFRLILTEEIVVNNLLQHDIDENSWFKSSSAYGIDAATQHEQTFGYAQNQWLDICRVHPAASQNSVKWLTNKPLTTTDMSVDDNEYIYTYIAEKKTRCKISFLTANNASTGTPYFTPYLPYGVNSIGIGIPNIIQSIGINQWNSVAANVHKVRYVIERYGIGTEITEVGEYKVNKEKCTTERLRVYWKNRKGGIDGYTFNGELSVTLNARSKKFKTALGYRRDSAENVLSAAYIINNTYGSSTMTTASTNMVASETINVTSRYHKQDELRWLSEIITSPQVWIENLQSGNLTSVYSVQSKAITKPKGKSLGQMKLQLRMSNEVMTQR